MGDDTRSKIPLPTKNEVDGERWQVIGGDGVDRGGRAAPTVFAEAGVVRAGQVPMMRLQPYYKLLLHHDDVWI